MYLEIKYVYFTFWYRFFRFIGLVVFLVLLTHDSFLVLWKTKPWPPGTLRDASHERCSGDSDELNLGILAQNCIQTRWFYMYERTKNGWCRIIFVLKRKKSNFCIYRCCRLVRTTRAKSCFPADSNNKQARWDVRAVAKYSDPFLFSTVLRTIFDVGVESRVLGLVHDIWVSINTQFSGPTWFNPEMWTARVIWDKLILFDLPAPGGLGQHRIRLKGIRAPEWERC